MLVDLESAKDFLRVKDFDDDDDRITALCEAAEQIVVAHVGRAVHPIGATLPLAGQPSFDRYAMHVTRAIEVAILQVVDGLYHDTLTSGRDGSGTMPDKTAAILAHLRVWREDPCHEVR